MNELTLRLVEERDLAALAALIAGQNRNPETQCIHSETGESERAVYEEMATLHGNDELCFVLAHDGDRLVGALGSELDEEMGRGWLRGPFVLADGQAWETTAAALLDELAACLSPSIRRLDSFLNEANERGNTFYQARGFSRVTLVHVYSAPAPAGAAGPPVPGVLVLEAGAPLAPSFAALHDATFPETWITGQGLLARLAATTMPLSTPATGRWWGTSSPAWSWDRGRASSTLSGSAPTPGGRASGAACCRPHWAGFSRKRAWRGSTWSSLTTRSTPAPSTNRSALPGATPASTRARIGEISGRAVHGSVRSAVGSAGFSTPWPSERDESRTTNGLSERTGQCAVGSALLVVRALARKGLLSAMNRALRTA